MLKLYIYVESIGYFVSLDQFCTSGSLKWDIAHVTLDRPIIYFLKLHVADLRSKTFN